MIILDELRVEMTGYRKEMTELADVLNIKGAKAQLEELNAMSYISDIYDSQLRSIFLMRFLKGYSWTKIANEIGGGNTADSVRMQVTRYLSSEK